MESPLTPGMSSLLYFGDETYEYPALENGGTPSTKDRYGGYTLSQKDLDAGNRFLTAFDSPRTFSANKAGESGPPAYAQTPALTTGPSATNPTSSQASPSVSLDYFSRPRQPNSDGSCTPFVTAKPVESNDFNEFRNAINKRFNRAREAASPAVQRSSLNHECNPQPPTNDDCMDFIFSDFEVQQRADEYRESELLEAVLVSMAPGSGLGIQSRPQSEPFHYPDLDPALAISAPRQDGLDDQKSSSLQQADHLSLIPPPLSPKPVVSEENQPQPIKRRRRRKAPPSAEVKAQKHKAFLERNREAASKCRTKKKTQIQQLEEDEREGRALNQMLKDEFRDVLGEVLLLREQVKLRQMACGGDCAGNCGAQNEKKETEGDLMTGLEHNTCAESQDDSTKVGAILTIAAEWESESESEGSEEESEEEKEEEEEIVAQRKKRKGTLK